MSEPIGTALGASYRLMEKIGAGATGEVWRAEDSRSDTVVAAKLLRAEYACDHDIVARFVSERSILTKLIHPGIVAVLDLVAEGEKLAIVMEYIDGGSLGNLLKSEGTLPPVVAVKITALILDGLAAAHAQNVLHRDVKPDNILLTSQWRNLRPGDLKLTDFGIARMLETQTRRTSGLIGTAEYMSPEFLETGECSLPADIYATGILLYELLAGRTPYAGPGNSLTIANRHVNAEPPRLDVPDALWEKIEALLNKNPSKRPTAAVTAAQLRQLADSLEDLPALPLTPAPKSFKEQAREATIVRGSLTATEQAAIMSDSFDETPLPELGQSGQATMVRPMPKLDKSESKQQREKPTQLETEAESPQKKTLLIAAIVGVLVLVIAAVAFVITQPALFAPSASTETQSSTGIQPINATQQDSATPTGLTIARSAIYDPAQKQVALTITYTAQTSPLRGPFLEILPGLVGSDSCPNVAWEAGEQQRNLPSNTGIITKCGWSLTVPQIPIQSSETITGTVSLTLPAEDTQNALQKWLDTAAGATASSVADPKVFSTSYPVQRLQAIELTAPLSTVTKTALDIALIPVWPSGADELNPLFRSLTVGSPSTMLQQITDGTKGVRFSDACSGAVAISADGLSVTTLTQNSSCVINAQVGNFTQLASQPFAIVTRGK